MKRNWLRVAAALAALVPGLGPAAEITPERAQAIEAILGAPENRVAGLAWGRQYEAAMRRRLRELAASGEPRNLYVAGLLWDTVSATVPGDAGRNADDATSDQARGWLQAALDARPRDALVARFEIDACRSMDLRCDPEGALQFLLASEPDNAEVQLRAVHAAHVRGDQAAVDRHRQGAALATHFDAGTRTLGQALAQVYADVAWPVPSGQLSEVLARVRAQGVQLDLRGMALSAALQPWGTHALPAPSTTQEMLQCGQAPAGTPRWDECMSLSALLAKDDSNLQVPSIGVANLIGLTEGRPEQATWRQRQREIQWLQYASVDAMLADMTDGGLYEHTDTLLREGELSALRRRLQRGGSALVPPPDWTPGDAPMVGTGGSLIIKLPKRPDAP